jgi:hypothetical protein
MKRIRCKGTWSVTGRHDCKEDFSYIGEWNDQPLIEHQALEKGRETKKEWWTGFETDPKFDNIKEKIKDIKKN